MGFYINDEQKIRINLSERAANVIENDLTIFSTFNQTKFLNRIIENFHTEAKASFTAYCSRQLEDFKDSLTNCHISEKAKAEVLNTFLHKIQEETKKELCTYLSSKQSHMKHSPFRLNNNNCKFLRDYNDARNELDIYDPKSNLSNESAECFGVSKYIKCIIEEYSTLSLIERIRIIKKNEYTTIKAAIHDNLLLEITKENQTFKFYPYKIISDNLGVQDYLTGYSQLKNELSTQKKVASFSMIRLEKTEIQTRSSTRKKLLSEKEIKELENSISKRSASFLLGEETQIRVRLTNNGKALYHTKLNYRPLKIDSKPADNEYVFSCTEQQAYIYFLPFGADAEIISPPSLRNRIKEVYEAAYRLYNE